MDSQMAIGFCECRSVVLGYLSLNLRHNGFCIAHTTVSHQPPRAFRNHTPDDDDRHSSTAEYKHSRQPMDSEKLPD